MGLVGKNNTGVFEQVKRTRFIAGNIVNFRLSNRENVEACFFDFSNFILIHTFRVFLFTLLLSCCALIKQGMNRMIRKRGIFFI